MNIRIFTVAAAALLATAGTASALVPAAMKFKGNWKFGANRPIATPSFFEIGAKAGEGTYCYHPTNCKPIKYTIQGSNYVFTANGADWFVFTSPEPGMMTGKFWHQKAQNKGAPAATVTMQQISGPTD